MKQSATHPHERIRSLDVLRGIAILGILLANIPFFAGPYDFSFSPVGETWNRVTEAATLAFVNGKWRSLLAILFGVGIYLQYRRRSADAALWPGGYLKRCFYLGLIGLAHGLLIWYGDILFVYSITAFAACFLVNSSVTTYRWIIGIGLSIAVLGALACLPIAFLMTNAEMVGTGESTDLFGFSEQVYATGSWWDQFQTRLLMFSFLGVGGAVVYAPMLLPLFVIGIWWARDGVLVAPSMHPRARRLALGWGLGVGLPLNLLAFPALMLADPNGLLQLVQELLLGPLLAVGVAMGVAVTLEKARNGTVLSALSAVGKTALTCYLMQSILATAVFYSWGLGLFGTMSSSEQVKVVVAIWIANIGFAVLWLRRFDIGPVEWLWRSLTEGRRLPWRTRDEVPVSTAGTSNFQI